MADGDRDCIVGCIKMNRVTAEDILCGFLGLALMSSIFIGDTQTAQLIASGVIGYIGKSVMKGGGSNEKN